MAKIKMVKGPFAGNVYTQYEGERIIINNLAYCVSVELIPGDYYRGITQVSTDGYRSPGTIVCKVSPRESRLLGSHQLTD